MRLLRHDLHWTQGDLAERVGIDRGYISQIETGHVQSPGAFIVRQLAVALETTADYLLGISEDSVSPTETVEPTNPYPEIPENIAEFIARLDEFPPQLTAPIIAHLHSQIDLLLNTANHLSNPGHPAPAVNSYDRHRHNSPDE